MTSCLHPIRADGRRTPWLVTHGLQCDTTFAAMLAKASPSDQPIYAYSAPGLDGSGTPLDCIDAMAARYAAEACNLSPPAVTLVGFCAGGHVALNMRPLLEQVGIAVTHVHLVDTPREMPPGHFDRLADQQVEIAARRLVARPELKRHFGGGAATVRAYTDALKRQQAKRFEGPTTIICSAELHPVIADKRLGWGGWLPATTRIVTVAPTRDDLLLTAIGRVADIARQTDDAEAERSCAS